MSRRGRPAGNVYDKYHTPNPIARRLVAGHLAAMEDLIASAGVREIHETGCGEGHLSLRLAAAGYRVRGSDADSGIIQLARHNASTAGFDLAFKQAAIEELQPPDDGAELVLAAEVLEHTEDPDQILDRLAQLACPYLLASVPREPLWRFLNLARGKYLTALGNTPGHLQHWSARSFRVFLERRFQILAVRHPLPWTVVLCRTPSSPSH